MSYIVAIGSGYYSGRMKLSDGHYKPYITSKRMAKEYKTIEKATIAAEKVVNNCTGIDGYDIERV